MTKAKEQIVRVKVNPASRNGTERDEVSIQSAAWEEPKDPSVPVEPYINRMVYAKPGIFTDGELSEGEVATLEEKSRKVLADDEAAMLAKATDQGASAKQAAKTKETADKSEG